MVFRNFSIQYNSSTCIVNLSEGFFYLIIVSYILYRIKKLFHKVIVYRDYNGEIEEYLMRNVRNVRGSTNYFCQLWFYNYDMLDYKSCILI